MLYTLTKMQVNFVTLLLRGKMMNDNFKLLSSPRYVSIIFPDSRSNYFIKQLNQFQVIIIYSFYAVQHGIKRIYEQVSVKITHTVQCNKHCK